MSDLVSLGTLRHRRTARKRSKSGVYSDSALRICLAMLAVGLLLFAYRFLSVRIDSGVMEFRQFIRHHIISLSSQNNELTRCSPQYNYSIYQMVRSVFPD